MATEQVVASSSPFSVVSVVEEILQQHGTGIGRSREIDLVSRKADESSFRRTEAAVWLKKIVGVVGGKDLPTEPSEEEFRLALRSGVILCNVLNKVQPGAVPKVMELGGDDINPDGAGGALSAFQYFEYVRNFLVAVEEMGLPTFEASDLNKQGGKSAKIVDCVLALKSYNEWKQSGGTGTFKYGGSFKPPHGGSVKPFMRKILEPARTFSLGSLSSSDNSFFNDLDKELNQNQSRSLHMLVRAVLANKHQEEIPNIVETMLNKVKEEFERRLASQQELIKAAAAKDPASSSSDIKAAANDAAASSSDIKAAANDTAPSSSDWSPASTTSCNIKMEEEQEEEEGEEDVKEEEEEAFSPITEENSSTQIITEESCDQKKDDDVDAESKIQLLKQQMTVEQQQETQSKIQLLKQQMMVEQQQQTESKIRFLKQQMMAEQQQRNMKQQMMVEQQQTDIQELKNTLQAARDGMQILQIKHIEEFNNLGKHLHGITHAASGYQRVLEENRKLYNQIQDLKGNIRVYCRVRPFLPGQQSRFSTLDHIEEGNITIITPSKYGKEGRKTFTFNKAFGPSATQEEVFADTRPLIRSVLDGFNVCIFAYGQTGSGKTYTMTGPKELTEEGLGVNYRALSDLFHLSEQRKENICYEIKVQMLEIYNDQVRDLLSTDGLNKKLEIRNSSHNGINVPEASLESVSSPSDVLNLMDLGHKNRAVSATAMNDRSSRSHSCLTVHVQGRVLTSGNIIRGSMHLVDLAGSERVDKSEVTGDRLKEAVHINKSLSALGDVIGSLAQRSPHVPYRNSRLTQLLQDSLGGQAKTLMFVHISPEGEALSETISTLKFAERVATVELGAAKVNKESSEVKELKEQIASLKAALARKDTDSEQLSQNSRSSTPERHRMKLGRNSVSQHSWQSVRDSNSRRNSMDNASSSDVRSNPSSIPRRNSLDLNDLITSSPPWPPVGIPAINGKEDDKESAAGDWVDKVMVNRLDDVNEENLLGQWDLDGRQLPEPFYQGYSRDPSKIYPEQACNNNNSTNKSPTKNKDGQEFDSLSRRFDVVSTDGSDDFDAGTSDCSEPDLHWQSNLPRTASLPNGLGSKPKRTTHQAKAGKRPETNRSLIPSLIPSPSRKPNGVASATNKPVKLSAVDLRRKAGRAK